MKRIYLAILISIFTINLSAQITVSSNNYVGIGTPTPGETLEINGNVRGSSTDAGALKINNSNGYLVLGPENSGYCHMYTDRYLFLFNQTVTSVNGDFGSFYNSDLIFKTGVSYVNYAGTVRMTIKNSSGYVGINNTNPSYNLDVSGIIRADNVSVNSDARLKENIKDMSGSLASLVNLKGVTYKLKTPVVASTPASLNTAMDVKSDTSKVQPAYQVLDTALYNRDHIGFLAQDVQKVFPQLVYTDKNGMLSVDYVSLIPVLVESIKEQQLLITDLIATVDKLKKKANIN